MMEGKQVTMVRASILGSRKFIPLPSILSLLVGIVSVSTGSFAVAQDSNPADDAGAGAGDEFAPPPPPPAPEEAGDSGSFAGDSPASDGGAGGTSGGSARPATPAQKSPSKKVPPGQELVSIDFPEATSLRDIIKAVSQWTGKNFILGQGVSSSAKVSIISPQQVTKEEA